MLCRFKGLNVSESFHFQPQLISLWSWLVSSYLRDLHWLLLSLLLLCIQAHDVIFVSDNRSKLLHRIQRLLLFPSCFISIILAYQICSLSLHVTPFHFWALDTSFPSCLFMPVTSVKTHLPILWLTPAKPQWLVYRSEFLRLIKENINPLSCGHTGYLSLHTENAQ